MNRTISTADAPRIDIRVLTSEEDRRQAFGLFRQAMLGIGDLGRSSPETEARFLAEGSLLGGYESDILRGVVNGYDSSVALPGGKRVRHLSVTHVGVSPEAKRRGIARRLLVDQLQRARAEGYVVAGLRASDARIYSRYGYGIGSWSVRHELDLTRTGLAAEPPRGWLRLVDAYESFPLFRKIADGELTPRAAVLSRWEGWWSLQEYRTAHGATPCHAVVFGEEGQERGFLRFHVEPSDNWFTSPSRTVIVDDLIAHDSEAWRGLIGHLFAQDILHRVVFASRPVDDPLPLILDNPRALQISGQRDESWIRPLDLQALLSARSYDGARTILIEVVDPIFPENAGIWSIGPEGAERSTQQAQAMIAIEDLTSLIFGAQNASALAAAGKLGEVSPEVTETLDRLFAVTRQPHSAISF